VNRLAGELRCVQPTAGSKRGADGVEGPQLLDVRERGIDERSAERSPCLAVLPSGLRLPNARLESTDLRPATQLQTRLDIQMGEKAHFLTFGVGSVKKRLE
jgi:hypothetical protein